MPYAYTAGDPINATDPTGLCSWLGCVASAFTSGVSWAAQPASSLTTAAGVGLAGAAICVATVGVGCAALAAAALTVGAVGTIGDVSNASAGRVSWYVPALDAAGNLFGGAGFLTHDVGQVLLWGLAGAFTWRAEGEVEQASAQTLTWSFC